MRESGVRQMNQKAAVSIYMETLNLAVINTAINPDNIENIS